MEKKQFWLPEDQEFFEKYFLSIQRMEFNEIISNWDHSSVKLKNWINKYFPEEYGKYDSFMDINVNHILPYRNNGFWKNDDLWRLEYAIKAKLIILGHYGLDEVRMKYAIECLRLWLRYDSRCTKLSWRNFVNLVDKCYIDTETNLEDTVVKVQEICAKYKHKRKQTLYHYKEADFNIITEDMKLGEAYEYWITYEWPYLLERYKQEKIKEFRCKEIELGHKTVDNDKWTKFKNDLELIRIKKPSKDNFKMLLNKFKIKYRKQ